MKEGRSTLLILTGAFLLCELVFNYFVLVDADGDLLGISAKTLFFLLLILLFSRKLAWAKWVLSIALVLYGVLSFLIGFEYPVFFLVGIFEVFFGIFIHRSKVLLVYREGNSHDDSSSDKHRDHPTQYESDENVAVDRQRIYPLLLRRFQALFIDGMLILSVLITIMFAVEGTEMQTTIMIASAALLLNYEPLLTTYSRTLGQRLMIIKVGKHNNPSERINLLNAYVRWFVKVQLGWISFITIHFNPERRAIHDLASGSVMFKEEYFIEGSQRIELNNEEQLT